MGRFRRGAWARVGRKKPDFVTDPDHSELWHQGRSTLATPAAPVSRRICRFMAPSKVGIPYSHQPRKNDMSSVPGVPKGVQTLHDDCGCVVGRPKTSLNRCEDDCCIAFASPVTTQGAFKAMRYAQATHASDGKTGSPPTVCLVRCSSSRRPVPTSRLPCPVTLESPWASQQIKLAGGFFSTSQASSSAVHGRKKHGAAPRKGRIQTQWDTEKRESVFGCASCFSLFETFSWSRETIIICEPMLHQVIIPLSKKRVPTNKTPGLGVLIVILLCFNTKRMTRTSKTI